MKGIPAFGVLSVVFLTFVTGWFAPLQAGDDVVRLRVSGLPSPGLLAPANVARQRAVAEFLKQNPGVVLQPAEGIKIETLATEVTTIMMVAGDIAPDVLLMNFRSLDTFVSQGMVASLDDYVAQAKAEGVDVAGRILPQVRDVVYRPWPEGERHLYGLPDQFLLTGIYYNKELFRRAGLPQRPPRTWDEMLEFARKVNDLGPPYRGMLLSGGRNASWNLMNFIWSAGGEAVKEVAPNDWRADFNTPQAVTAFEFYYQLVEAERLAIRFSGGVITAEDREKVGMFFGYLGDVGQWNPDQFGFGAVPRGPTGLRGSEVNSQVLGVFSGIKDPRVRDAAWRYVLFMTGPTAERIRVETMVELGQASQVSPALLKKYGYKQYLSLTPPGLEAELEETLQNAKPEPYGKNCNLIYMEMNYPLDRILLSSSIRASWNKGDLEAVRREMQDILNAAVVRTNERMVGYVAPEEMRVRRIVAMVVVALVAVAFVVGGWYICHIFNRSSARASVPVASRGILPWLCLLPACGLILLWSYIPLARGTVIAFQDHKLLLPSKFVGFDNFAIALFDPTFWNSITATFHFAAYTLTLGFLMPILLAYGLHIIPKYKVLYRTVYYLPAVMSAAAVFFMWREMFAVDGPLNMALRLFGFEGRRAWTDEPSLAMLSCVIPGIWAGAGPGCLIYLAALKTIPEEQFEAAEIDGAGFWHKTINIIYPGLRALIFINFVGAVAAAFHGANNILIMTGGGPSGATEVISLRIFYESFARLRFGPATAMAWILGSLLIGFTVIQLKRLSQMEFKTTK